MEADAPLEQIVFDVPKLPPYDHDAACPKCHFMAGTTDFYPGYHGAPCPIPEADKIATLESLKQMFGAYGGAYYPNAEHYKGGRDDPEYIKAAENASRAMDLEKARIAAIPEHFDRRCPNCKHLWAERPT